MLLFASVSIDIIWSILILSGRYHIISNASLVNNCILLNSKRNIDRRGAEVNMIKFIVQ